MDLASNELAYLPSSGGNTAPHSSRSSSVSSAPTASLVQQVTEHLLAQATQQQDQMRSQIPESSAFRPAPSSEEEQLTPEQLQFLAEEDARQERRHEAVRELTTARSDVVARRLDELVLQFEQLQQQVVESFTADEDALEEAEISRLLGARQMMAKLDFTVQQSALELQVDDQVHWTRLLEELPMQERDYMGRAADEKFVEQMKYLRGEREAEREGAIQQHLHGILVLTAPHRNGQTVAKTSMHHSLRHLLQAFVNIFRGCYAGFLQYGGQGFGVRMGVSVDRVTCTLPLVAADVTKFAAILTQVVLFKYRFLQTSEAQRAAVERNVLAALFEALQPTLHGLFVASFQREDAIVDDLAELSRTKPLEYFEVKPLFRLDGSWPGQRQGRIVDGNERRLLSLRHYNAAIYHMNNLASNRSPYAKLERLAHVCEEIDRAIKQFYDLQPAEHRPPSEHLSVYVVAFASSSERRLC
jgi:hypothetical protein